MHVYLAAPFGRKEECRLVRKELALAGIDCTSRWIDSHLVNDMSASKLMSLEANVDLEDISRSEAVILLNMSTLSAEGTGGKHFECGYAVALGIPVYVLGPPTCVFHHLPGEVECFPELGEIIQRLRGRPSK